MSRKRSPVSAPGPDNFEFEINTSFGGYNSSVDPSYLKPGYSVAGSINTYLTPNNTIGNRPGRKLYDASTDSTIAGVVAGTVWETSLGTTYPIRVANSKLQVESAVTGSRVWYDLLTSLTLTRFVFDTYWDTSDKKDKLLAVNGGTNVYDWSGGLALFVSAIAATSITLDRDPATSGFSSSGTVTINGSDYAYTGIDSASKKLTGVTGDASAEAANSVVMQKINTTAYSSLTSGPDANFAIDIVKVINNQAFLASYTSRLVYMSKNSNFKDFGQSSPRLTGEGDLFTLDDTCTGIGTVQGDPAVFGARRNVYLITFSQITVGSTLSEQSSISKVDLGEQAGAREHEFIGSLDGDCVYIDGSNQLRMYGKFRYYTTPKMVLLSQDVQNELFSTDLTNGQLSVVTDMFGDNVYITAPNSSYVYWFQQKSALSPYGTIMGTRIWQPPQLWGVSRIDVIQGETYGFSNSNPQIYQLWNTSQWYDDSPSGQLPYRSIVLFPYQNGGRRQGKIVFDKTYVEGLCTEGSNLYLGYYFDYQGATSIVSPIISDGSSRFNPSMLFSGAIPPSLGDASLGSNPLGDGINTTLDDRFTLSKFREFVNTQLEECYEFAPMVYSQDAGDRWELLAIGQNLRIAEHSGVEIMK